MRTDRAAYTASYLSGQGAYRRYTFTVVLRTENRTRNTVYLKRCTQESTAPIYFVGLPGDSGSLSAFNVGWLCVGVDEHLELRPGAVRQDTLHLTGPNGFIGYPNAQPEGVLEGDMQVGYTVFSCPGGGSCRLPDAGLSNSFTVTLAPAPDPAVEGDA